MKRMMGPVLALALLLSAFALPVFAQGTWPPPEFTNSDMKGSWAVQVTGDAFLPAPFNAYNGPFVRTGRLLITPDGKIKATVTANYAGTVERETLDGIYTITSDGRITISLINVPLPSLPPGLPNVFSFDGVICDGGKRIKLMMSGVRLGAQDLPNIGSVIYGELVRQ